MMHVGTIGRGAIAWRLKVMCPSFVMMWIKTYILILSLWVSLYSSLVIIVFLLSRTVPGQPLFVKLKTCFLTKYEPMLKLSRKEWRVYLDDGLGDLDVCLLGGDQVSLVTAFPLKYFSKLTLES